MYITRVKICLFNPEGMRALSSPHIMHGIVSNSFPGGYDRNTTGLPAPGKTPLWRVDSKDNSRYLLLVSDIMPDKEYLAEHLGDRTDESVETKEYDKVFEKVNEGVTYRFKIDANPTITKTEDGIKKRIPLLPENTSRNEKEFVSQKEWFISRAKKSGFAVNDVLINGNMRMIFKKGHENEKVVFQKTTFEGFLTVTDKDKFVETLKGGIGREKAYGCGMLSIAEV